MGSPRMSRTSLLSARLEERSQGKGEFKASLGSVSITRPIKRTSQTSENDRIRERFLQKLGIESQIAPPPMPLGKHSDPSLLRPSRSVISFEQALKDDPSLPKSPTPSTASNSSSSSDSEKQQQQHVHFDTSVTVYEIPSRHHYSNRISQKLWTPLDELAQNVARNSLEFESEKYDWKRVVDDHAMVIIGDELVHPIHFGILVDEYRDDE